MADAAAQLPLAGQRALVTGASRGIGAAIAQALARAGARVGVNYASSRQDAEAVLSRIRAAGGEAIAVGGDVSREEDVVRMFDEVRSAFGSLDIVVANAGIQRDAPLLQMTLDDWQRVIGVNLTGQFLCAREAAREFVRRGPQPSLSRATGKIVCISSVHQRIPWAGHVNYAASKGGIGMLMASLAQELAEHRIRVNAIAPGAIGTDINATARDTEAERKSLLNLIPYGRIGDVDDVARAAVWLCSDDSDYVTGATLYIDGGMTLYPAFRHGG